VSRRTGAWAVSFGIIGYVVLNLAIGLGKNAAFHSTAWDLGLFNQAFDSTLHGTGFFAYTLEPYTNPSGSFFGVHFSPILLLILPIYAVYPSIVTLLSVQAFALGIGAIPVYRLSLLVLRRPGASLAIAISYLLYFPMQAANLFDFHVEALVVAPLLFSIYYLYTRRWKRFGFCTILALATIEYAAFLVIALGLAYLLLNIEGAGQALKARKFRDTRLMLPAVLSIVAVAWFILARAAMAAFNPAPPTSFEGASNWSVLGAGSIAQIPFYALLYPANALRAVMFDFPLKLEYVWLLLWPLLLLPVLRPRALVAAVPWVAFAFLSNYPPYYQLGTQYAFLVVPGLFWALILAVQRLQTVKVWSRLTIVSHNLPKILVVSSMIGFVLFASTTYPVVLSGSSTHLDYLDQIIQLVPEGSSVLTQNNLFPHFDPAEFSVFAIPITIPAWLPNYNAMVNLTFDKQPDFILVDGVTDPHAASVASQWLRENGGYGVYASADGIILFKRSFAGTPELYVPVSWTLGWSDLTSQGALAVKNSSVESGELIYSSQNSNASSSWVAPAKPLTLPPGQYNLTMSLKTAAPFDGSTMLLNVRDANGTDELSVFRVGGTSTSSWTLFSFSFPLQQADTLWLNATSTATVNIFLQYIQVIQMAYIVTPSNTTSVS
jgi:uncharacterized membrane protein